MENVLMSKMVEGMVKMLELADIMEENGDNEHAKHTREAADDLMREFTNNVKTLSKEEIQTLKEGLYNVYGLADDAEENGDEKVAQNLREAIDKILGAISNIEEETVEEDIDVVESIMEWQKERMLDKQPYDALNEATSIVEEILEGFGYSVPKEKRPDLRDNVSNMLVTIIRELDLEYKEPTESDKIDSITDQIVFSIGAIMKLGFNPKCALSEVFKEINSRTGSIVDGKFQKDTSPKAKSQWISADYLKCKKR